MHRDDENNNGKNTPPVAPAPEQPLPQQDDTNLGDDFTKAGEGTDLTNDQQ